MPRIQFSDVTPPEKRSIRDVPIPSSGRRKAPIIIKPKKEYAPEAEDFPVKETPTFDAKMSEVTEKKTSGSYEYYYPKKEIGVSPSYGPTTSRIKKKLIFGGIAMSLILVFVVSMMTVFASATINIVPKSQIFEVDTKIVGVMGEAVPKTTRYEVVKLSESKTATVPATGEEAVELKASGKIMVYNNFSTEPQRLIVRTRFESPDGLIYRIGESIVVPGKTVKGGVETPGSIEAEIFADEAGEKYNIKKTDFTIPGFKNDSARFKSFYGRSVTNLEGGFIGKRKKVSETDKQTAMQNIETELKANLEKNLQAKVSEDLALLSGSIIYKSKELAPKEEASSVILGKELTAYAVLLNKQDLSEAISNEYVSKASGWENIRSVVKDFSLLKIANTPTNPEAGGKIDLQLNGSVKALAYIDTNIINQKLLGAPKGEVVKLMDEFTGISSITATIRPIWKRSFPQNPEKIYIQTALND